MEQLLAKEEPDTALDIDDERPEDISGKRTRGDEDVDGLLLDDGPDPGQARLVGEDEESHPDDHAGLVAHDAGIDGGTATAEEAAIHAVGDDDYHIRSGDWRHR